MTIPTDAATARRVNDAAIGALARRFGEALRVGDARLAGGVAEQALTAGAAAATVHARVIEPAMEWIGELWERGAITVADEHLATAISQDILARLFPRLLTTPARSRDLVMLAAAQGEHHVLGLRMIADVLEGAGFTVLLMGSDLPADALLDACRQHKPQVVGLSASMPLNVPTLLRELVELYNLDDRPLLMAGGRALRTHIPPGLDVPVVTSAENALEIVEQLLASHGQGPPLQPALLQRLPQAIGPATATDEIGTIAGHFSATAQAAAETARSAARRAHMMEQLALRDGLTGLWNRRAFDDRFTEMIESSTDVVLLMVDVDRFKTINDTWGHASGDAALRRVASAIMSRLRPTDFAARYGGDEFIVLLPGATAFDAVEIAERIRIAVTDEAGEPPVTVSIGVAAFSGDQRNTGITVDKALYRAKSAGRNRVAVASA